LIIFFGTKPKTKTIGSGQFYCPNCKTQRSYERKQAKNYFTLYFIPLFPIGDLGEFVECQVCHLAFQPEALNYEAPKRQRTVSEMLNSLKSDLEKGAPVEYALQDLTAAGLDRDVALQNVRAAIGAERKNCKTCGLAYASNVKTCASCGQVLS
jgi:hypothetical protein